MNESDEAEAVIRQSIVDYPFFRYRDEWFQLLADVQDGQLEWAEVADLCRQILDHNPADWRAYFDLAGAYHELGALDRATEAIEQAQRLAPMNPNIARRAGMNYEASGSTDRAVSAYRRVPELWPGDRRATESLERLAPSP